MSSNASAYVPLPKQGDYIRLLELAPGDPDNELVGKFVVHDLSNASPQYIAISYVCGNDDRSVYDILISGSKLGIYKNADEVLRRFRSPTDIRYLWIDVACIDQDDRIEKAREVSLMYKVYQNAAQTMIWMGPADSHSQAAIAYARTLDAEAYLQEYIPASKYSAYGDYWEKKSFILDVLADHPDKESLVNSCAEFFLRAWFSRVWTQQEGALSSTPIVVCGSEEIPWAQIFSLAWLFQPRKTISWPAWFLPGIGYAKLEPNIDAVVSIHHWRVRQMMLDNHAPETSANSLLQAMRGAAKQNCYDPRDKIFAMSNIASDLLLDDWAPEPDYTTTWEEVYTDFAARMAERGDKEVLAWSGVCQQGADSGLPSWVVDWRSVNWIQYCGHIEWSAGSRSFRAKVEQLPKKRQRYILNLLKQQNQVRTSLRYSLQVTVVMQDTVVHLSGVIDGWVRYDDIQTVRGNVLDRDQRQRSFIQKSPLSAYITSEPVTDAYNATLIANTTNDDKLATSSYVADGVSTWRRWLSDGADLTNIPAFHDAIDNMDTFVLKQFCVSARGYFGLVPHITKSSDVIAIVKGLDIPVVLRPVGEYFIHLGDCYVHGMMEFQAGTLIEEFRVRIRDGKPVWNPAGDVRRNGKNMDAGEYVRILDTLGERKVSLI
ncbi:uncharacterized protein Z518_06618 [Rhinocladiella mackenziei CBS 650.93]|uniref:Rhinocladiella mackenziei CBS 650.93 unplaced genomic scaffold supercont1.5, whole genome shotgun sequence n=1 Tax=Rhinocladiella mackenziei CBS 650.93 TaxID=1442369 RepID=A0A0D2GY03_9EURO|nr:uncharacterized protein Z518_06618 [Rhinocladiella mackenziei CBS 650.93]KIX03068.1 hypothetical protein Z518_06618 [Rhinocladiella mackenziei CBS 650.93]